MPEYSFGKTTIAPEVLITIARMSALNVPGVSRMAPIPGGLNRVFKKGTNEGVRAEIEDGLAYLDLYLILKQDVNVREVGRQVQQVVSRSVSEMLGIEVGHVNIHVEGVDYEI
jgi:uncharacterized alkaline shock family protein YloU